MIIAKFLNLLSTILGGIGSILLIKAVIAMTPDVIAEMSHTDLYYSKPTLQSLASQKADVMTGATVITMAFAIQFLNQLLDLSGVKVSDALHPLVLLFFIIFIVLVIMLPMNLILKKHYVSESSKGIVRLLITKVLYRNGVIQPGIMGGLKHYANDLLSMPIGPNETDEDYLERVSEYIGISNGKIV